MKILLFGADGQVGWELQRSLAPLGQVVSCDRQTIDLTDLAGLGKAIEQQAPDVIVNAAAYTAVDRAESEPDLAQLINGDAVAIMAEKMQQQDGLLIHYSTDYVYDGTKTSAYLETDPVNPLSVYGRTKLAGERAIQDSGVRYLIFRTSWVYAARGNNFIKTMLRLAKEKEQLRIISDQQGAPTSAELIADATALALYKYKSTSLESADGVYHLVASGSTSWFELACYAIQRAAELGVELSIQPQSIEPITTSEYPLPAVRPQNSVMDNSKFASEFGLHLPLWKNHVNRVVLELEAPR